jgi:hypothetical protein
VAYGTGAGAATGSAAATATGSAAATAVATGTGGGARSCSYSYEPPSVVRTILGTRTSFELCTPDGALRLSLSVTDSGNFVQCQFEKY